MAFGFESNWSLKVLVLWKTGQLGEKPQNNDKIQEQDSGHTTIRTRDNGIMSL